MKDFRGTKLEVGDKVAVLPPNYRNMVEGVIEKFTAKQATIVYKPHHHRDDIERTSRSSDCIVFIQRKTVKIEDIPNVISHAREPSDQEIASRMQRTNENFYCAREALREEAFGAKPPGGGSWGDYWKSY